MMNKNGEQRAPLLPLRNRRTLAGNGEESIASTLYCPVQERSVAVAQCEGCARFRALYVEPHITSVMCHCEAAAPSPAEEAVLRDAAGGLPDPATPLADIMTKEVVCVRSDMDAQEVKDLLLERGISGVPVVNEQGKPIGVISRADVLRLDDDQGLTTEMEPVTVRRKDSDHAALLPSAKLYEKERVTAVDLMNPVVLVLHESANIGQAASLMAFEGIHRLPIVSDEGEVVGILSALDVLRWFGRRSGYMIPRRPAQRQP